MTALLQVWSVEVGEELYDLPGHEKAVTSVQYRHGLGLLVTGAGDMTVRLWDLTTRTCIRVLRGHERPVRCLNFDSERIVSGDYGGDIKVWDLPAARGQSQAEPGTFCIRTLSGHRKRVFR